MPTQQRIDRDVRFVLGKDLPRQGLARGPLTVPVAAPQHFQSPQEVLADAVTVAFPQVTQADGLVGLILDRFISELQSVDDIIAIVAEVGDVPNELHVTTFARHLASHTRASTYGAERHVIDEFPDRIFDFHLRTPDFDANGQPVLPEAPYCLILWRK